MKNNRIPIILDTDIGSDIDDIWALALLLGLKEKMDVRLVSVCFGNTLYRGALAARFLECAGRTDIPIAIGENMGECEEAQARWLDGYRIDDYKGNVCWCAAEAICNTIMASEETVTVISIGPAANLAAALDLCPEIMYKSRIIGMYGSIFKGYFGAESPCPECNAVLDMAALGRVISSGWDFTMIPLDACGSFRLSGRDYQEVKNSKALLPQLVMQNYEIWDKDYTGGAMKGDISMESSILYDIPPVLYAMDEESFICRKIPVEVAEGGCTKISDSGTMITAALGMKDEDRMQRLAADMLAREE
jgi:inosine-uridine nucleoside N-ribohydrolase